MVHSPQEQAQIRDLRTKQYKLRKDRTHAEKKITRSQARKESQRMGRTDEEVGNHEEIIERIDMKEEEEPEEPRGIEPRVPDLQNHQKRNGARRLIKRTSSKRTIRIQREVEAFIYRLLHEKQQARLQFSVLSLL